MFAMSLWLVVLWGKYLDKIMPKLNQNFTYSLPEFWEFSILIICDNYRIKNSSDTLQILTLSNPGTSKFWHFQTPTLSAPPLYRQINRSHKSLTHMMLIKIYVSYNNFMNSRSFVLGTFASTSLKYIFMKCIINLLNIAPFIANTCKYFNLPPASIGIFFLK